jgi:diadenosine tetraphosphatase ApaH/serine/threonine PP2A family protein phosphatase
VRYAIVSDIHSNLEALRAALDLLLPDDRLLCLGDIVGYGPNPNECVGLIRERATTTVLGNHDVAAIDDFGLDYFNAAARTAIEWTQGVLSPENKAWLGTLDYQLRTPQYLLVHGAPVNYFAYIIDNPSAAEAFEATDAPLVFVGHTHLAEYYARSATGRVTRHPMRDGGDLQLEPNVRYVVNVGSVGQPRDGNPMASFAFYDDASRKVSWQRYDYPIENVRAKMKEAQLPPRLADRLLVGR